MTLAAQEIKSCVLWASTRDGLRMARGLGVLA